jgi:prefoldin subunit 1
MRVIETRQKLRLSDMQIEALKMDIRRCEITDREMAVSENTYICRRKVLNFYLIQALPENTPVYESVGHAFFLESVPHVRGAIEKKIKLSSEKIKTVEV